MTVTINTITYEGDLVRVNTDNTARPEFVYKREEFDTFAKLQAEIDKSIAGEAARASKKTTVETGITMDLQIYKTQKGGS